MLTMQGRLTSARQVVQGQTLAGPRSVRLVKPSTIARASSALSIAEEDDHTQLRKLVSSAMNVKAQQHQQKGSNGGLSDLMFKLQLCFKIFFPDKPKEMSPKEEVKRRLKMVLVADRCGMSPGSLQDLKKTIAKALQDFVDIESEESIEVKISSDPGLGTVYQVAIPVRRVKPEARFGIDGQQLGGGQAESHHEGVILEWDPTDFNSDPSGRFPMGC